MTGKEYQDLAMRTNDRLHFYRLDRTMRNPEYERIGFIQLMNGCLGLAGESGEFLDTVKKWIFHEQPFDEAHMKKELGDACWYIAMICEAMDWNLDEILKMNIEKLKARYPQGFDTEMSNHRQEGDI